MIVYIFCYVCVIGIIHVYDMNVYVLDSVWVCMCAIGSVCDMYVYMLHIACEYLD